MAFLKRCSDERGHCKTLGVKYGAHVCAQHLHRGCSRRRGAVLQSSDFSDAKLVTPYGEIPWNKLSRIRNDEMREFMRQVVDRLYTVLLRLDDPEFVDRMDQYARRATAKWDEPRNLTDWFSGE
jgi:hypothetical protein